MIVFVVRREFRAHGPGLLTCCRKRLYSSLWEFLTCLSLDLASLKVIRHCAHCRLSVGPSSPAHSASDAVRWTGTEKPTDGGAVVKRPAAGLRRCPATTSGSGWIPSDPLPTITRLIPNFSMGPSLRRLPGRCNDTAADAQCDPNTSVAAPTGEANLDTPSRL